MKNNPFPGKTYSFSGMGLTLGFIATLLAFIQHIRLASVKWFSAEEAFNLTHECAADTITLLAKGLSTGPNLTPLYLLIQKAFVWRLDFFSPTAIVELRAIGIGLAFIGCFLPFLISIRRLGLPIALIGFSSINFSLVFHHAATDSGFSIMWIAFFLIALFFSSSIGSKPFHQNTRPKRQLLAATLILFSLTTVLGWVQFLGFLLSLLYLWRPLSPKREQKFIYRFILSIFIISTAFSLYYFLLSEQFGFVGVEYASIFDTLLALVWAGPYTAVPLTVLTIAGISAPVALRKFHSSREWDRRDRFANNLSILTSVQLAVGLCLKFNTQQSQLLAIALQSALVCCGTYTVFRCWLTHRAVLVWPIAGFLLLVSFLPLEAEILASAERHASDRSVNAVACEALKGRLEVWQSDQDRSVNALNFLIRLNRRALECGLDLRRGERKILTPTDFDRDNGQKFDTFTEPPHSGEVLKLCGKAVDG